MKQKYNLRLLNEDIRIVSENGEEYVKSLRKYIHTTIGKFDNIETPFPMPYLNKALYACVFLADELFEARAEIEGLKEMLAAAQEKPAKQGGAKNAKSKAKAAKDKNNDETKHDEPKNDETKQEKENSDDK